MTSKVTTLTTSTAREMKTTTTKPSDIYDSDSEYNDMSSIDGFDPITSQTPSNLSEQTTTDFQVSSEPSWGTASL